MSQDQVAHDIFHDFLIRSEGVQLCASCWTLKRQGVAIEVAKLIGDLIRRSSQAVVDKSIPIREG